MSDVPERGKPETRTNVLPDFVWSGRLRIGAFFEQNRESLVPFWNLGETEELFAFRVRVGGTPATAAGQSKDFAPMEFCFSRLPPSLLRMVAR